MPAFRVHLEDGTSYVTSMAKGVTLEQAKRYFVGETLNFGDNDFGEGDRLLRVVDVTEVK